MAAEIRPARMGEAEALAALEQAAGERFRAAGMASVADGPGLSLASLEGAIRAGEALVALVEGGEIAGFAVATARDGEGYLKEVSVHPRFAGRRLGAALIEACCAQAREAGRRWMVLSTFREVPWNAPYYARLGFSEAPREAWGPSLRAELDREAERGLSAEARVVMRRRL